MSGVPDCECGGARGAPIIAPVLARLSFRVSRSRAIRLRRFMRLDPADRGAAVEAAVLMAAVAVALTAVRTGAVRAALGRLAVPRRAAAGARRRESGAAAAEVERAVRRAAAVVPRASCLVQALAAEAMLGRRGCPARLHVGFARGAGGALGGHAWVESGGCVVAGGGPADAPGVPDGRAAEPPRGMVQLPRTSSAWGRP